MTTFKWTDETTPPPSMVRTNVDEMRGMAVTALRLLNEKAVSAGQLYTRLIRLEAAVNAACRFIAASDQGQQMKGQYEDLEVGRELRIALDDAKVALEIVKGAV